MAKRDYYDVLGCSNTASESELKKAYRTKAKELHPDRNADKKNAEEDFKLVNEAYEILKDPNKKAAYDTNGYEGLSHDLIAINQELCPTDLLEAAQLSWD